MLMTHRRVLIVGLAVLAVSSCSASSPVMPDVGAEPPPAGVPGPSPAPSTPPPPATPSRTRSSASGSVCSFVGLRDVRLGGAEGPYVQQVAYTLVPCAPYGFNHQNPAPGQTLHCDYGPIKTTLINNPMPGMSGLPAVVRVPMGSPGSDEVRISGGGGPGSGPSGPGDGAFRTQCGLASFAFEDPIVYPGRANASHLHMFFGNTGVTATSTPESLRASPRSTCRGGTANSTAYWVPAMVDVRTGAVQAPSEATFYYKTGYGMEGHTIRPTPAGLRMIAGDKNATARQEHLTWYCINDDAEQSPAGIPAACGAGSRVRLTVVFPQCWDGKNLDAADHKSHMAYPEYRNAPDVSRCPASHPVPLPEITEHFDWPVIAGASPAHWRLSSDMYGANLPGGLSAHADWMNGWDPATMNAIVTQCLNRSLDCGVNSLGDGRVLN